MGACFLCHLRLRTACKRTVGKPAFQLARALTRQGKNVVQRAGTGRDMLAFMPCCSGWPVDRSFLSPLLGDARVHLTGGGPP